jgi:hypothetical protein
MSKYDNIPVIVQQLIENMHDNKSSIWTRDNYCTILERIRTACDAEIIKFNKEKTKALTQQHKKTFEKVK